MTSRVTAAGLAAALRDLACRADDLDRATRAGLPGPVRVPAGGFVLTAADKPYVIRALFEVIQATERKIERCRYCKKAAAGCPAHKGDVFTLADWRALKARMLPRRNCG
jgi:hypothetical protein